MFTTLFKIKIIGIFFLSIAKNNYINNKNESINGKINQ